MFFNKKKKLCLIGLDGVPCSLLKKLLSNGVLPNLSSLFKQGNLRQMSVSIPEVSSVSWSSFMTGTDSGNHGIYGFMDVRDGSRQIYFPNYLDLKGEILWEALEEKNKKSVVINLPSTYPARKINGVLVSGFVAIDLEKAVYPSSALNKLKALDYRIDVRAHLARDNPDFLFKELHEVLKIRFEAFELFLKEEEWDFFMPVITGTDRLHHFLWVSSLDPADPYYQAFYDYYRALDEKIGRLISLLPRNTIIMLISDHGFTKIETEVYLNSWLKENNYLDYNKDDPQGLNDIAGSSRAFALDPSRIYLNKKTRFDAGILDDNEAKELTAEIAARLADLKYNSQRVIRQIFRPGEIYSDKEIKRAPDLILLSNYGFDLKGRLGRKSVFGKSHFTGMHTQDDAFFFSTADSSREKITIFEIKNKIVELMS